MEYTVQKLANIAGVTTRTLRYYDEIGLLRPARVNSAGYRFYSSEETDRLQQILFYRELGLGLDQIHTIMHAPDFDIMKALRVHRRMLLLKKQQVDSLLETVEATLRAKERDRSMEDAKKFEGFKQKLIQNYEEFLETTTKKHRENLAADNSNGKIRGMTQDEYNQMQRLSEAILEALDTAYPTGDPACPQAQQAAALHKKWLCHTWSNYTKEAHAGLANIYVEDTRFSAYYDRGQPGKAEFLRDSILIYLGLAD